jgi:hypothetical protein
VEKWTRDVYKVDNFPLQQWNRQDLTENVKQTQTKIQKVQTGINQ